MARFGASYTSNPSYKAAVPHSSGYSGHSYGASYTSNPSYKAAVPHSSGYSGHSYGASYTSNPSYKAAVPHSSGYSGHSYGASYTSNPSYKAAVPHSSGYSGHSYGASYTSNPSYKAAVPHSSGYSDHSYGASYTSNPSYKDALPHSSGYSGHNYEASFTSDSSSEASYTSDSSSEASYTSDSTYEASYTSDSSYEAAVPHSSGFGGSSGKTYISYKLSFQPTNMQSSNYSAASSYTSNVHNSRSKSAYPSSSKYNTQKTNLGKLVDDSSKNKHSSVAKYYEPSNKSLLLKKPHSDSTTTHSSNYPNPNFLQLLPVSTQFSDPKTLPKSMQNMSISDQVVNFYPVQNKGPNYLKYCIGWLRNEEKPKIIRDCVWQYTSGPNWYCTEVNMALASDSPKLGSYGRYIRQLKYSIGMSKMRFTGTVFRGADMSPSEIEAYETKNIFFMPSFTSTSKSMPFKDKNTLFHVDISPEWSKFCMEIQPEHTKYAGEEEILFSCYNLYQYQRTEKSNGQRIIKLHLMNYEKYFDYRTNTILNYHV